MSNLRKPKNTDEEEFESLFESFGGAESQPAPQPAPKRDPGQRFSIFKRRRQATQATADVPAEEQDAVAPVFDAEALKTPLDLDAAREEFLRPEPEESIVPIAAPTAADEARTRVRRPKQRTRDRKVKPLQILILGVLLILVLAVYGALALIITRTRLQTAVTPIPLLELETATIQAPAPTQRAQPTATSVPPTPTMTPIPPVSTQFDLRLLQDPNNVGLRIERGYKYLELRAYDLAINDFEHARGLEQQNPLIHVGLGQAHFYAHQWEQAEQDLNAALTRDENSEEAHFWFGTVLYYAGQYAKAATEFDWAAELNPENPRNEAWLALAAASDGQLSEAEAAAERAIALDAKFAPAYLGRAQVRLAQGDEEAAQGDLLYARSLAPYDFNTLHALGRFYADHVPERIVEAERLVLQAQNWAIWDIQQAQALHTLGRIYLGQGRIEEAQQALRNARDLAWVDGKVVLAHLNEDLDRATAP